MSQIAKLNTAKSITLVSDVVGATDYTLTVLKPDETTGTAISISDDDGSGGNDGVYRGTFTPDAVGVWLFTLQKAGTDVDGVAKLKIDVVNATVDDVYTQSATIITKVDAIKTVVDSNATKLDTIDGVVDSNATKLDDIKTAVDAIPTDSPNPPVYFV